MYSWRDAAGVYHFTNRAGEVPSGPLDAYSTFEDAVVSPDAADSAPSDEPEVVPPRTYGDGVEEGRRLAEEQAERERELAALEAPPAAPQFEIEPPAAPPVYVTLVPADGYVVADPCAYDNCWIGGSVVYGGPFYGGPFVGRGGFDHGRFDHGRHGQRTRFAGHGGMHGRGAVQGPGVMHGHGGMHGAGGRGGFGRGR